MNKKPQSTSGTRLNKFIANAGICSRREADKHIADGKVKINGEVVREMGYKVQRKDTVEFEGKKLQGQLKEYILLNKPKDFITTVTDDRGRKTVMDLVKNATQQRIYPVGRLDRMTTGLLLFTNDGALTEKLTHPKYEVRKIYHVVLNKNVSPNDLGALRTGLELEDGAIKADKASFVDGEKKNHVGIEIHSGRNRIVRRMFEHLGYDVERLDRVVFAGLTKKDLPRGKWRKLTQEEVRLLRNFT